MMVFHQGCFIRYPTQTYTFLVYSLFLAIPSHHIYSPLSLTFNISELLSDISLPNCHRAELSNINCKLTLHNSILPADDH